MLKLPRKVIFILNMGRVKNDTDFCVLLSTSLRVLFSGIPILAKCMYYTCLSIFDYNPNMAVCMKVEVGSLFKLLILILFYSYKLQSNLQNHLIFALLIINNISVIITNFNKKLFS